MRTGEIQHHGNNRWLPTNQTTNQRTLVLLSATTIVEDVVKVTISMCCTHQSLCVAQHCVRWGVFGVTMDEIFRLPTSFHNLGGKN